VVAEMQARWLAQQWSARSTSSAVSQVERQAWVQRYKQKVSRQAAVMPNSIEYCSYMDGLAADLGVQPSLPVSLLDPPKSSVLPGYLVPLSEHQFTHTPMVAAQYRLCGPYARPLQAAKVINGIQAREPGLTPLAKL
jgi:hypothetical protein